MPDYVATLRALFSAADDAEAIFIADQIKVNGEQDLDSEEGDTLEVYQVTSNALEISPTESIDVFKRARNLLIKTRIRECIDMAREFDKMIYILEHRESPDFAMAGYDYGTFVDVLEQVLIHGQSPQ